jgi:hypothetical protein
MEVGVEGSPSTMSDWRRLYPDTTGTCPNESARAAPAVREPIAAEGWRAGTRGVRGAGGAGGSTRGSHDGVPAARASCVCVRARARERVATLCSVRVPRQSFRGRAARRPRVRTDRVPSRLAEPVLSSGTAGCGCGGAAGSGLDLLDLVAEVVIEELDRLGVGTVEEERVPIPDEIAQPLHVLSVHVHVEGQAGAGAGRKEERLAAGVGHFSKHVGCEEAQVVDGQSRSGGGRRGDSALCMPCLDKLLLGQRREASAAAFLQNIRAIQPKTIVFISSFLI